MYLKVFKGKTLKICTYYFTKNLNSYDLTRWNQMQSHILISTFWIT